MDRRRFIRTSGISLATVLMGQSVFSCRAAQGLQLPNEISALWNGELIKLTGKGPEWKDGAVSVRLKNTTTGVAIFITASEGSLSNITLRWNLGVRSEVSILNDHWERTYGDISWHPQNNAEVLPWYFMEHGAEGTNGFGVKTGGATFCSWTISNNQLSLTLDSRSGSEGVLLNGRELAAAEVVTIRSSDGESPFATTRRFMSMMCDSPRLPKDPVYGINDWYFTYGNNSADLILEHTNLMAPMAGGLSNKPFSVIDAGWFETSPEIPDDRSWGAVDRPNKFFGDMASLAEKIRNAGMRPGLWTRPLCGSAKESPSKMLSIRGDKAPVLDPSIPENVERIKSYFQLYHKWGYDLVKFDYTSFDIFGKWGMQMVKDGSISSPAWKMNDQTKTNAEIILNLYQNIRAAAGNTYIIGCNTFSHLSAGLFEINRIGDDTSGNEWERTRKMGVNTLAFRGVHHGKFYAADADCVGLTTKVAWDRTEKWLDLVSKSGTPLFISAQPEATGAVQKQKIKEAFALAAQELPLGEPLDWMTKQVPEKWKLNGKEQVFNWA